MGPWLEQDSPESAVLASGLLTRVVYRSRATIPFASHALHSMVAAAQVRNAAERITGLVIHDSDWFYQWLEGPADGIERVLWSINNDCRHTDISVLSHQTMRLRTFAGWAMRLAGQEEDGLAGRVIRIPPQVIAALHSTPNGAAAALSALAPRRLLAPRPAERPIARLLRHVILTRVVPELAGRLRLHPSAAPAAHPRATDLATLLVQGDTDAAAGLLRETLPGENGLLSVLTRLVEPAAIVLGDMWTQGDLEEVDVTLGLCRLRAAVCQAAHPYLNAAARSPLRVLSAASPGEVHALGPTLHPQVMWQAGWSPRVVAGESEDALLDTLAREHFDCLDLSGSAALPGDDRVHALAATIARARRASRNPALAVLLGGRGAASLASRAGADAAVLCARDLVRTARAAVELRAS